MNRHLSAFASLLLLATSASAADPAATVTANADPTTSTAPSPPRKKGTTTKPPAAGATSMAAPTTREREVREIAIDEARANKIYRIRTAPGYPAIVEFPEAFAAPPACGDCGEKGLFRLDVFHDQHYITVKPRTFPGEQPDGSIVGVDEFITSLNVRLQHFTLTLQVEFSDRDKADARVVFSLPSRSAESAYVREEISKARQAMEAEFAAKIEAGVTENFLRALAQPHRCSQSSARARKDDIVLEITDLCQYGRDVYIRFSVENRGRLPVQVSEVLAKKTFGRQTVPVEDLKQYVATPRIDFQKSTLGVVAFTLPDGEEPTHTYELTLIESGGRNRQIVAGDLSF